MKSYFREQEAGAKAIPAHPALLGLPAAQAPLTSSTILPQRRQPFGQREAHRHLQAYGGRTDSIDWVMDCVRLIAETGASAEWHLEKDGEKYVTDKGPNTPDGMKEAPFLLGKLMKAPNPYMDYEEFLELIIIDYLLVGNSYLLKYGVNEQGQPLALYRMAPPFVEVVPGNYGIEGYTYKVPGQREPLELKPEQVVHFKQANPHDPYLGLGTIQGGSRMFDLELALTNTQASYYEKAAMPSMVVQSDRRVPKDVFNRLRQMIRAFYQGANKAGEIMVLEAGLKYQAVSPSAVDAAFESLTNQTRDRIFSMFRVPAVLVGLSESAERIADAQRVFDTKTMRPLLNKLQRAISRAITDAWGFDFIIDHDYVMPVEERIRLTSSFASLPGVRVSEVRDFAGLDPLGDERDDIVLNLPGEEGVEGDTTRGHPDAPLASEPGRPPRPENTSAFPQPGQPLPASARARPGTSKSMDEILAELTSLEDGSLRPGSKIQAPEDIDRVDRERAVDDLASDLARELDDAVHYLERGLLDTLNGKAGSIRQRLRQAAAWETFRARATELLENYSERMLSRAVIRTTASGISGDEDLDYESIARGVVHRPKGIRKAVANLKNQVSRDVSAALVKAPTIKDAEAALRLSLTTWRESKPEEIALTELTHAYNEGVLSLGESAGRSQVAVHDGDEHDQPCVEANGQVWDIDYAREHRIEHPRCRRAFTLL